MGPKSVKVLKDRPIPLALRNVIRRDNSGNFGIAPHFDDSHAPEPGYAPRAFAKFLPVLPLAVREVGT
jgi:hypothetical protein